MRLFELQQTTQFDPLLIEFWQQSTTFDLKYYFVQNNCRSASFAFLHFLEGKNINNAEIIPIGRFINGVMKDGWVKTDLPDLHFDALTKTNINDMRRQQLNPRNKNDRITYINSSPQLYDEFCYIPHSWVELHGKVLDPSGYYIDGKSGQFDKFTINKTNLPERYHYFG